MRLIGRETHSSVAPISLGILLRRGLICEAQLACVKLAHKAVAEARPQPHPRGARELEQCWRRHVGKHVLDDDKD